MSSSTTLSPKENSASTMRKSSNSFHEDEMKVVKRNGKLEVVSFDKILKRIKALGAECNISINYTSFVMKVIDQIFDGITTMKIDELSAELGASLSVQNPDYSKLAGYIIVSNHHKNTPSNFFTACKKLYNNKDIHGKHVPVINETIWKIVQKHKTELESMIQHRRDYDIDYFGFKTLERSYLLRVNNEIIERPQYLWMRVSIAIHGSDMVKVKESYNYMSSKYFTHATPTLFNAGTLNQQLSSCYLIGMEEDSITGIYKTLQDCAQISKFSGGIGLHIHNIRAKNSHIRGTNGKTDGIVPMLKVFNATAKYVNQSGKRNGSFAIYLEPWHPDVEDFLDLRKNHGDEELRARDLFYALWIPDLFMHRVKSNGNWSLFCPDECPGLSDTHSAEFEALYTKYENDKKYRKQINARELWFKILDSQMETGTPYILYKDASNRKSNQQNLGTIKSSNLCTEIIEYSDKEETAVCNLASLALSSFVVTTQHEDQDQQGNTYNTYQFDYQKLHDVTKVVTENLNRVIDLNFYPTEKTIRSNMRHRPIGIGVQGLADVFAIMRIPFYSKQAREINKNIFETIYHAALEKSNEIAKRRKENGDECEFNEYDRAYTGWSTEDKERYKGTYSSFPGSPASQGTLQFDLWNVDPTNNRYDWTKLKEDIKDHGLRNSLLVAPMPTASTSQILGNNECFEPFTSNIYTRRTLAGEFIIVNKYLMRELIDMNMWSEAIKTNIIENNGSIQHIEGLSEDMKNRYRTVWEIPMRHLIDMSRERGAYICQSQSLNLWMEDPTYNAMTSMHFYSWEAGLKTGIYYLRRKAKHQAQQFTVEPGKKYDNEPCEMCSA
jgi:ribonucleoside-diphosphate reductase alpha chain